MKKIIILLITLLIKLNALAWELDPYRVHLANYEVKMINENEMVVSFLFQEKDFSICHIESDNTFSILYKSNRPSYDIFYPPMRGTRYIPDIPTSGCQVLLPADKEVEKMDFDTIGLHLFAKDILLAEPPSFAPLGAKSYKKNHLKSYDSYIFPAFACFERENDLPPFRCAEFCYSPFEYNLEKKELLFVDKIIVRLKLKQATILPLGKVEPKTGLLYSYYGIIGSRFMLVNSGDIEKFYGNILSDVKSVQNEHSSAIIGYKKEKIYGTITTEVKTAILEIRNLSGVTIRKDIILERGSFTYGVEGLPDGVYLCSLKTDEKLTTKKISINRVK